MAVAGTMSNPMRVRYFLINTGRHYHRFQNLEEGLFCFERGSSKEGQASLRGDFLADFHFFLGYGSQELFDGFLEFLDT